MKLSEIKIQKRFLETKPREEKLKACRDYMDECHQQSKPVVLDENNLLVDGYVQYLVLKERGIEEVDVKIVKGFWRCKRGEDSIPKYRTEMTTYLYCVFKHKNGSYSKQYVWRVPKSWSDNGWERDVLPGDKIFVNSKGKSNLAIVTKIHRTESCPSDFPVKRVTGKAKKIWKN